MSTMPSQSNVSAALNLYIYLDDANIPDGTSMSEIISKLSNDPRVLSSESSEFKDNFEALCAAVKSDPSIGDLIVSGQSDYMPGYEDVHGCVFTSPDGEAYVAFRGTGDGRWIDNGEGLGPNDSNVQKLAASYFDKVAEANGWNSGTDITITGHSKGGNLSQYITMASEKRFLIDRCISIDGQGFSPEAIERFKNLPGYEDQISKLWSISGESDIVNQLGYKIVPDGHDTYIDQNGDMSGVPIMKYHYLTNVLDENGQLRDTVDGPNDLGIYARTMSDEFMSLPPEQRKEAAIGIMTFIEAGMGKMDKSTSGFTGEDIVSAVNLTVPMLLYALHNSDFTTDSIVEMVLRSGVRVMTTKLYVATLFYVPIYIHFIDPFTTWAAGQIAQKLAQLKLRLSEICEAVIECLNNIGEGVRDLITLIQRGYNFVLRTIDDITTWFNENFNKGYRTAMSSPSIYINTDGYAQCAQRLANLYWKIRRIEGILDEVYWWHQMPLDEYHAVGNANRRVGSLSKIKKCKAYFDETANDFNEIERKYK